MTQIFFAAVGDRLLRDDRIPPGAGATVTESSTWPCE